MNVNPPTSHELFLFSSGQMGQTKRESEIKQWLEENPFGQEAMEGLALDPHCQGLKTPSFLKKPSPKKGTQRFHFLGWGLGLGFGALLALLLINQSEELSLKSNTIQQNVPQKETIKEKIDTAQIKHQPSKPSTASPDQQQKKALPIKAETVSEIGHGPVVIKGRDIVRFNPVSQHGGAPGNGSVKLNNPCIEILGYSVYPYKERAVKEEINLPGLPANEGVRGYFIAERVPYLKAIEKAIEHYQDKNHEICIFICEDILLQYPNDINALYLIGRCLFEEGLIEQSKTYFQKTLKLNQGRLNEKEIKGYLNIP
jgi:tetratricopeptide (TPR) repeat protein